MGHFAIEDYEKLLVEFGIRPINEVYGLISRLHPYFTRKVVFIHRGKIIGVYSVSEILNMAKPSLIIKVDRVEETISILEKYGRVETKGEHVVVSGLNTSPSAVIKELVDSGFNVQEVRSEERSLEDFFFNLIKDKGDRCEPRII